MMTSAGHAQMSSVHGSKIDHRILVALDACVDCLLSSVL